MSLGVGLGLFVLRSGASAAPPRAELVLLRLANLAATAESTRLGFALDLEGPPLVDELPAGALTTLLPGPAELRELWVLPRGLTLPKSLPEPLPLALAEGASSSAPLTIFLFDRPGPRGEPRRQLLSGAPLPAAAGQLRVLNLWGGAAALDVCPRGAGAAPLTRAVPAWGLSHSPQWFARPPAASAATPELWLAVRTATEPPCRGGELAAVQLQLSERGTFTLVLLPRAAPARALRALALEEGSLAPERAVPLPVWPPVALEIPR